jgi:hypothetical protein
VGEFVEEGLKPVEGQVDERNGFDDQRQQEFDQKYAVDAVQFPLS